MTSEENKRVYARYIEQARQVNNNRRLHPPARQPADGGGGTELVAAAARALATGADSRAVVLVEGVSDQVALEALAERRGRTCPLRTFLFYRWVVRRTSAASWIYLVLRADVRLAGLCDAGEEGDFRRSRASGLGSTSSRRYGSARFLRVRRRPGG